MAPASPHKTPPRRSSRGIPIASPSPSSSSSRNGNAQGLVRYVWQGGEIQVGDRGDDVVDPLSQEDKNDKGKGKGKSSHVDTSPGSDKKRSYTSFLRITEPRPPPTNQTTPRKSSKSTSAVQPSQLRFSVGDGVLVACAGNSIGIGLLVGMWEEVVRDDEEEDENSDDQDDAEESKEEKWEKMCEVRWCYRRQDLPNTMGQMKLVDHEILYSASSPSSPYHRPLSTSLPLTSLIHTCTIITSKRFKDLYPMWHESWDAGWAYVQEVEEIGSEEEEEEEQEVDEANEGRGEDVGEAGEGNRPVQEEEDEIALGPTNKPNGDAKPPASTEPLAIKPSTNTEKVKPSKSKFKPLSSRLAIVSKASPPTLSLSLSFSSFNPHRRPIPIVYYLTRALDKFGKGGEGKSWWWVDWEETQRRGREEGDWGVVVDRERRNGEKGKAKGGMSKANAKGKEKQKVERDTRAGIDVDEESEGKSEPEAGYNSASESEDGSEGQVSGSDNNSRDDRSDNDSNTQSHSKPLKRKRPTTRTKLDLETPRKRPRLATGTTPRKTPKTDRIRKDAIKVSKPKHRTSLISGISNEIAPHLLPRDPYERALHLLHVGATPDTLPCREEEFMDVLEKVEEGVEGGGGGCLYIAGVPGTGKTATVHAVIKQLRQRASDQEIPPFTYVEINGLKVPTPQHAYNVLWEAISGQKSGSAKTSLRELEMHFREAGRSGPRGHTTVVLMDELDQLLTAKQDVVYNFFNWPTMRDSHLYVIAIANRMDLPQFLASKVKSRLGLQSLLFQPYDKRSLVEIVKSRLIEHPVDEEERGKRGKGEGKEDGDGKEPWMVLTTEAIELAAAKMAGTNGDARRVLDACRRAVETSISNSHTTSLPPTPVTIREMSSVLKAMTSSPIALFIKQCSLHQKMMMAAMLRCVRREGVGEVSWRAVRADHDNLLRAVTDSNAILTNPELYSVFSSLVASHALTFDGQDKHKSMEDRKIALGMDGNEVGRVLMGEGERWSRVLAGM